jgi:hypothetical protein
MERRYIFCLIVIAAGMIAAAASCTHKTASAKAATSIAKPGADVSQPVELVKQSMLPVDIALAGIVVGRPLPAGFVTYSEPVLTPSGIKPDTQVVVCANAGMNLDAEGNLLSVFMMLPETPPKQPGLSRLEPKSMDMKPFLGLPKDKLLELYGEPSEMKEASDANAKNKLPLKYYYYYYQRGHGDIIQVMFAIPSAAYGVYGEDTVNTVTVISYKKLEDKLKADVLRRKVKLFPWPEGI